MKTDNILEMVLAEPNDKNISRLREFAELVGQRLLNLDIISGDTFDKWYSVYGMDKYIQNKNVQLLYEWVMQVSTDLISFSEERELFQEEMARRHSDLQ